MKPNCSSCLTLLTCFFALSSGMPPPRMIRLPGGPSNILPPGIPPPHQASGGTSNILSAPPSIMRPREEGVGPAGGSAGQSRVTIQAKPQIKSKMGDVTRFMPTALKVKREARDQKGRLRVTGEIEISTTIWLKQMPNCIYIFLFEEVRVMNDAENTVSALV